MLIKCPLGSSAPDAPETLVQLRRGEQRDLLQVDELSRAVFNSLPFFFMLVDSTHTILYANRAVTEAVGGAGRDLTGAYCPSAIHGLDHPFPGCPLEEADQEHVAVEREFYDGEAHVWTSSAIYPTNIRSGAGLEVYAHVVRDISAQRNAQAALRERAAVQQLISRLATRFLSAAPLELEAELSAALAMVAEFLGCARATLYLLDDSGERLVLAQRWVDAARHRQWEPLPESLPLSELEQRTRADPRAHESDARFGASSPSDEHCITVPISVAGSPGGFARFERFAPSPGARMRDADLHKLVSTTLSVGIERLRAAQGMSDYARRLRSMALELSTAEARERRRIAADLHDQIGQTLALSMMKVSSLRAQVGSAKVAAVLDEVHAHIEAALTDAKSLMFELSPPVLHQFGLGAALEWLLEQCASRTGLDYRLDNEAGASRLDDDQEMFLFRATQELLANVHRHAHARRVEVKLSRVAGSVEVVVADDGVGIPTHALAKTNRRSPRGFGLFSIEERLTHLGGAMLVDSTPGAGTRVTLRVRDGSDASKERAT